MDYFTICFNGFCLTVQSAMHIFFVTSLTGKKKKGRHIITYLFLLCILEWIADRCSLAWIFAIGAQLLILYGMNRLALGNRRSVSWVSTIIAVYISQLSFGIVNSAEAVIFPRFIGIPLIYLLVLLAAAASFVICSFCYITVLKSVSLKDDSQISDTELLFLQALGLGALLCTLYAYRRICRRFP